MRLILQFEQSDGYTYSCTNTYPVEYESAEALLVHLMDEALAALRERRSMNKIAGLEFSADFFYELVSEDRAARADKSSGYVLANDYLYLPVPPDIFTIDEWFATSASAGCSPGGFPVI